MPQESPRGRGQSDLSEVRCPRFPAASAVPTRSHGRVQSIDHSLPVARELAADLIVAVEVDGAIERIEQCLEHRTLRIVCQSLLLLPLE